MKHAAHCSDCRCLVKSMTAGMDSVDLGNKVFGGPTLLRMNCCCLCDMMENESDGVMICGRMNNSLKLLAKLSVKIIYSSLNCLAVFGVPNSKNVVLDGSLFIATHIT